MKHADIIQTNINLPSPPTAELTPEEQQALKTAQWLIHLRPMERQREPKDNIRHYCDVTMRELRKVKKPGFGKLLMEITRIKKDAEGQIRF